MKISFCTTCHNRLWQLKLTLKENLKIISDQNEMVLVNFGSTDQLSDWVWDHFSYEINHKVLTYFETTNDVSWNVSRAKSLAHRIAKGDYLFNLDADNYVSINDLAHIKKAAELKKPCHQWSGNWMDGSFGRIGLPKSVFKSIGGYDECLLPMGSQDRDLLQRLNAADIPIFKLPSPEKNAISNSFEDKIKSLMPKNSGKSQKIYDQLNNLNYAISKLRLEFEGPYRKGGGFSYKGLLNGKKVKINGFDEISYFFDIQ